MLRDLVWVIPSARRARPTLHSWICRVSPANPPGELASPPASGCETAVAVSNESHWERWRPRRHQAAKQKGHLRASAGPSLIPWRKGELILDGPRTPERILSPPVSARVERSGSSAARISRAAIADRRYNTLRDTMPAGTPALPVAAGRSVYCYDPGGTPALPPSPGALPLHGSTTRPTQELVEPKKRAKVEPFYRWSSFTHDPDPRRGGVAESRSFEL